MIEKLIQECIFYFERQDIIPERKLSSVTWGSVTILSFISLIVITIYNVNFSTSPYLYNPAIYLLGAALLLTVLSFHELLYNLFLEIVFTLLPKKHKERVVNEVKAYMEEINPERFYKRYDFHTEDVDLPDHDNVKDLVKTWGDFQKLFIFS